MIEFFLSGYFSDVWSIGEEQLIQRYGDSIQTGFRILTILTAIAVITMAVVILRKLRRVKKNKQF